MSSILFSFQATPHECSRLARMLRQASKQREGAQQAVNAYFAKLCARYSQTAPETSQIMITAGYVFVLAPEAATARKGKEVRNG